MRGKYLFHGPYHDPRAVLYILILPSISVTIVFIELKTQTFFFSRNRETLTETAILGINKTLHTDKGTLLMYF